MDNLTTIFNSISKNLTENEKAFNFVDLEITNTNQTVLNDDLFADITFDSLNISCPTNCLLKVSNRTFIKSAQRLTQFFCLNCSIQNSPPNYHIWTLINSINNLKVLAIGLDVDEIPSNAIKPSNGNQSKLQYLLFSSERNLTIKSNAFENLINLREIAIESTKIKKFEKDSFNIKSKSHDRFLIFFDTSTFDDDAFENGTFHGISNKTAIVFNYCKINYLAERAFKSFLDNRNNRIYSNSKINCNHCRNYWMIRDKKQQQIQSGICNGNQNRNKTLFTPEIQTKLTAKCKSN